MKVTVEDITPAIARAMLEYNVGNRSIRRRRVARYVREMKAGQWLEAGDPIRFDSTGRLVDGQHRLMAIAESGMTFHCVVERDLDPKTFQVMDSGLGRMAGDMLGTTSETHKAAIVKLLYCVKIGGDPRHTNDLEVVSRVDIHDFFEEFEDLVDASWSAGSKLYKAFIGGNRSAWGAFAFLAAELNKQAADEFLSGVETGADLSMNSPILALRNFLSNDRSLPNSGYHLALIIKAWNAWLEGKPRQVMVVRADEPWPVMRARRTRTRLKEEDTE